MISANDVSERIRNLGEGIAKSAREQDPDASVGEFIKDAGICVGSSAVYIYTITAPDAYRCDFFWRAGEVSDRGGRTLEPGFLPQSWREKLENRQTVFADRGASSDGGAAALSRLNLDSVVICPVMLEDALCGFAAFCNPAEKTPGSEALYGIAAAYIGVLLRHRRNNRFIDEVTHYDEVTGLFNFSVFLHALSDFLHDLRHGRHPGRWALVCFNISRFKLFNSQYGYAAGNDLLRNAGSIISEASGGRLVTRGTADRFYCLCRDEQAEELVRSVHKSMGDSAFGRVDVYAGICTLTGDRSENETAVEYAQIACGCAAGDFENYFRRFSMDMADGVRRNDYIIKHAAQAAEKGWIRVFYQPVYNSLSGRIVSYEALSRWDDPVNGFLSPGEFIPVLEKAHLLSIIDLCVLAQACAWIRECEERGRSVHVSVNLSRTDLTVPKIHERINAILDSAGVGRDCVAFEITESALVNHEELIGEHIAKFHADGYQVWLDDFGSGYSSLNALQRFDFDVIKLDMMFLRNPTHRTPDILTDVIDMSKRLGLPCITEGVETQKQLELLMSMGCFYAQGFYISKPLPPADLVTLLKGKGCENETPEDRLFYGDIARININFSSEPYIGKGYEAQGDPRMVTVVIQENGALKTVYTSEKGRQWLALKGLSQAQAERENTAGSEDIFLTLRDGIGRLKERGQSVTEFVQDEFFTGLMKIQLICVRGNRRAFLITSRSSDSITSDFSFDDFASGIPGAVLICKAIGEGRVVYANDRCVKLFGCDSVAEFNEFSRDGLRALVHPDDLKTAESTLWAQLNDPRGTRSASSVYRIISKDGAAKTVLCAGQIIRHRVYGDIFFAVLFERSAQTSIWRNSMLHLKKDPATGQPEFTSPEISGVLLELSLHCYKVRLVDPVKKKSLEAGKSGVLKEMPGLCFDIWKRGTRCKNCVSLKALETKGEAVRLELSEGALFIVCSQYVTVDGNPGVLETIYRAGDGELVRSDTRDAVLKFLTEGL